MGATLRLYRDSTVSDCCHADISTYYSTASGGARAALECRQLEVVLLDTLRSALASDSGSSTGLGICVAQEE